MNCGATIPDTVLCSQVTDYRDTYFKDTRREVFRGAGQVLGGETRPSRLVPESKTTEKNHDSAPTNTPEHTQLKIATQLPGKGTPRLISQLFFRKVLLFKTTKLNNDP